MAPIRLLELLILLTVLAGFAGLLLRRNLFLKVLSMDVMGSAVVACLLYTSDAADDVCQV
jgi:multicomponent Na+:H+ antiporter subunit C